MAVASPACHRYTDGFAAEADLDALSSPMTPATTVARSILYAKSISAREWTRELGSRSLGRPHDPERRRRMAESYHRFRAMSADAQREYLTATATGKFQDGLGAVAAHPQPKQPPAANVVNRRA
jgi:hypothetical protein